MPFPQIDYLIICDDIRPEKLNKFSLMGLYGVAPHVMILLKEFGKPVDRMTFMLSGEAGGGNHTVAARILDPDGQSILQFPETPLELGDPQPGRRGQITFSAGGITFAKPGKHTFEFVVDGRQHYRNTFSVGEGTDKDFQ